MTEKDNNWISVGALGEAFAPDSNLTAPSPDLVGKTITLYFENGDVIEHVFTSDSEMTWKVTAGEETGVSAEESYLATSLRPGIYFIDFVKATVEKDTSVSIILDLNENVATCVVSRLPDAEGAHSSLLARALKNEELTLVRSEFHHASVNKPFDPAAKHHQETEELVGLRIRHRYNPKELYEHIYLSPTRYTWQCIEGAEQGLADTDSCHYHKIGDHLYLFTWREKLVPTVGCVLMDHDSLKTTGKIFGYADDDLTQTVNFPVGAYSEIANWTKDATI
jgi:hypothetical protein